MTKGTKVKRVRTLGEMSTADFAKSVCATMLGVTVFLLLVVVLRNEELSWAAWLYEPATAAGLLEPQRIIGLLYAAVLMAVTYACLEQRHL